ncbi:MULTISPECIES: hypothetical protein [unclassified Streptomyces]|uniref:hypothetical protein n=1 Tax=unclassified Streptomyces TaxID=2593676 RepID=UPI00342F5559
MESNVTASLRRSGYRRFQRVLTTGAAVAVLGGAMSPAAQAWELGDSAKATGVKLIQGRKNSMKVTGTVTTHPTGTVLNSESKILEGNCEVYVTVTSNATRGYDTSPEVKVPCGKKNAPFEVTFQLTTYFKCDDDTVLASVGVLRDIYFQGEYHTTRHDLTNGQAYELDAQRLKVTC